MPDPLKISYDHEADVLTINGVLFAGKFFRELEEPDPEALYKIARDKRGSLTIRELFAPPAEEEQPPAPAPVLRGRGTLITGAASPPVHRCPNWLIPYGNKPRIRCRLDVGHGTPCEFVVAA